MFREGKVGREVTFLPTSDMQIGDRLILWVTKNGVGYNQGIYAFAEVISNVFHLENAFYDSLNNEDVVLAKITHFSDDEPFITKKEFKKIETGNYQNTNKMDEEHYEYIINKITEPNIRHEEEIENDEYARFLEVEKRVSRSEAIKRSKAAREEAIRIHGTICHVCGFDFEETYGQLGEGFIEVHHIVPLSKRAKRKPTDPRKDLVCLCANCHRMIHRAELTPNDLIFILENNKI